MDKLLDTLLMTSSDSVMFALLQATLIIAFIVAFSNKILAKRRSGKGGATLSVKRGKDSMTKFYGTYLALNGLLVAVCLSIELTKGYKIFWVIIDTLIPAYICIFNPWSRNKLLGWSTYLSKIEAR